MRTAFSGIKTRLGSKLTFLGIGNPSAKDLPSLDFAQLEVEEIDQLVGPGQRVLYEENATGLAIIDAVRGSTYLHFSCHGKFMADQPLDSALYLAGTDVLTLRNLLEGKLDLSNARLAVLSACQTAIADFSKLPEEAIGLPSGFLQAGVPGVVGTLWS